MRKSMFCQGKTESDLLPPRRLWKNQVIIQPFIYGRHTVIDGDGYRLNVAIVLCNNQRQLFWGRRIGQDAWQFPQGGIKARETPEQAMYRELNEEVGLQSHQVEVVGCTDDWLHYRLPERYIRQHSHPLCIGQKQIWFLLRLRCRDSDVCLDSSSQPEFDHWRWVKYWHPLHEVVYFKRRVYKRALNELAPLLFPDGPPIRRYANHLRRNYR